MAIQERVPLDVIEQVYLQLSAQAHPHPCTRARAHARARTFDRTLDRTLACTHKRTSARAHARTFGCTHAHRNTHTHTGRPFPPPPCCSPAGVFSWILPRTAAPLLTGRYLPRSPPPQQGCSATGSYFSRVRMASIRSSAWLPHPGAWDACWAPESVLKRVRASASPCERWRRWHRQGQDLRVRARRLHFAPAASRLQYSRVQQHRTLEEYQFSSSTPTQRSAEQRGEEKERTGVRNRR